MTSQPDSIPQGGAPASFKELLEELGVLADKADNFLASAAVLPLPDATHNEMLKACLADISKRLHELSDIPTP